MASSTASSVPTTTTTTTAQPAALASSPPLQLRITAVETLRCGAGFRDFCFVKMSTDGVSPVTGKPIVGWSEYLEERNIGITQVIEWMGALVVGKDPMPWATIIAQLRANTRHVCGGLAAQGIAAIENALLDVVGKALHLPVAALLGGPYRTELPVYWSHCGSFRVAYAHMLCSPHTKKSTPPLTSLEGCRQLGAEVVAAGYAALKTNIFQFNDSSSNTPSPNGGGGSSSDGGGGGGGGSSYSPAAATMYMPGFGGGPGTGSPELNVTEELVDSIVAEMRAFREGAGPKTGLKLDLNYNFKTDGYIKIAKALTREAVGGCGIDWLELDLAHPQALRQIRDAAPMPIASLESLMGRAAIKPYLDAGAVDTCIIDPLWNGVAESVRMAELCELYEVNCAAHNYHGWLGTAICAHFCAAIPNFKVLETDVDDVPWKDDIVTSVPRMEKGIFYLPEGPGWGVDVDEEAIRAHPGCGDIKTGIWSKEAEARE